MKHIISSILVCSSLISFGQITVAPGTRITGSNGSEITLATTGDLVNPTDYNFSAVNLRIILNGTSQTIEGDFSPDDLILNCGQVDLNGNMTVESQLTFNTGIINVPDTKKILFTGQGANVTVNSLNLGASYINGTFYQKGGGFREYPIGTSTGYAGVKFNNIDESNEEVGVLAKDGQPPFQINNPKLTRLLGPYFWEIAISDPKKINSQISVPMPTDFVLSEKEQPVIVQNNNGVAESLGAQASNSLTSAKPVTSSVVGAAITTEITVTIRELITPFGSDGVNDELVIDNIEAFAFNRITILDRYGVVLQGWNRVPYTQGERKDYFKNLSPGNYIVVAEFGDDEQNTTTKSQMVTVLKVK